LLLLEAELEDEDLLLLEAELDDEVLVALLEAELDDEVLVALLVDEVLVLEVEVVVVGVRTLTAGMVASSPMAHKSCPISIQI